MKLRTLISLAAMLLGLAHTVAQAEDIDLFTGNNGTPAASNLLVIIDNTANFGSSTTLAGSTCTINGATNSFSGKLGGITQCTLYTILTGLSLSNSAAINIGIMMYNAQGMVDSSGTACVALNGNNGGCLVYPLTGLTTSSRTTLINYIATWQFSGGGSGNIKSNSQSMGSAMQEAWAYYAGKRGLSGRSYTSIQPNTSCKNFLLFISQATANNTTPGDPSTGGATPQEAFARTLSATLSGGGSMTEANASPAPTTTTLIDTTLVDAATRSCGSLSGMPSNHNSSGFYADEWARYMKQQHRITTYTIALTASPCKPELPWLMNSMATFGGGKYYDTTSATELKDALESVFSEVRSTNSVFAAVSLPVSVNAQGTYLNQVYIGMFRPDETLKPKWFGNLKQYRMGYDANSSFRMLDADGTAAISSSGSEFLSVCARSYWTPAKTVAGDGYWSTYSDADTAQHNCIGYPATSNSPDGNLVEKGGQAYTLRSRAPTARTVKTCSATFNSCTSLTDFTTTNTALTTTALNVSSGEKDNLINWVRGANVASPQEEASLNGTSINSSNTRPSVHGDIVHSRPAALNFGTDSEPKIVVFYGGNDGVFRAVNGNRDGQTYSSYTVNGTSVGAGTEFFAFVPPEFYSKLYRLFKNTDGIDSGSPKDYALDGPITAYTNSSGNGWIYAGMRRGGRALYAFQIDKTTRDVSLKWKRGCGDNTTSNCTSSSYNGIGQTWAPPQVFTAKGYSSGTAPLLIMGGGYDATCEDATSYSCASTTGNSVFVLDADTGAFQRALSTDRGVVADVTIATDSTGAATYIWLVDLGGNIYRISGPLSGGKYTTIGTNAIADWVITKIARLGCDTTATCTSPPNRKFMFAPEVVLDGTTYVVLIGSGDREKPTNTSNATRNYLFAVKDKPDEGSTYLADTTNCGSGATSLCLASLHSFDAGTTPSTTDVAAKKGFAMRLNTNEQTITQAVAIYGTVYFNTHTPQATSTSTCSPNLGKLTSRSLRYADASGSAATERDDAGLSPDPVAGKVILNDSDNASGTGTGTTTVPFCIGCTGPLEASRPRSTAGVSNPSKIRSYWYLQK